MEKLIEILEDIQPDADYETCTTLIDDCLSATRYNRFYFPILFRTQCHPCHWSF